MSDEVKPTEAVDPVKNLKHEFDRKLDNIQNQFGSQIGELTKANQALLAQISATMPKAPVEKDDFGSLIFDNPTAAAEKIKKAAKDEMRQEFAVQEQAKAKTTQVLNQLVYDYPELQSDGHELTKRATAIYMGLDPADKTSPIAYKLAVKEAASELGIVPRAKRSEDEAYTPSGSGTSSNPTIRAPKGSKGKLAAETITFAKLMGLDTDDPKTLERIEKRQRDNWTKYR